MPEINFPTKCQFLFTPKRYKVLHGGRGSGKSWAMARALLLEGFRKPLRVLCVREFQASLDDSVIKLLKDQVEELGLGNFYECQKSAILGPNGTSFSFEGIRNNVTKIKSYEGIDVCWVEEAHKISENSWQVLTPTIRKPGSEIWISFNPELETDPTYKRFIKNPPEDSIVVEMNYKDNFWFPPELERERLDMQARDPDAYLHVWEGKCKLMLEGAVYAEELRAVEAEGRICKVPYDPFVPVDFFFDIGWSDATSFWARQKVGFEWHYLAFRENSQKKFSFYIQEIQKFGWTIGTIWLPHDAKAKELGSGTSIEEQVRASGKKVRIVKKLSIKDGIDAARNVLANSYFDETECAAGIKSLRHYRYEIVEDGLSLTKEPLHDWASHGSDAYRYSAIATKQPKKEETEKAEARLAKRQLSHAPTSIGWMR